MTGQAAAGEAESQRSREEAPAKAQRPAEGWRGAQEAGAWAGGCLVHRAQHSTFQAEHEEKVLGPGSPRWMRPWFPSSDGTGTPGSRRSGANGLVQRA